MSEPEQAPEVPSPVASTEMRKYSQASSQSQEDVRGRELVDLTAVRQLVDSLLALPEEDIEWALRRLFDAQPNLLKIVKLWGTALRKLPSLPIEVQQQISVSSSERDLVEPVPPMQELGDYASPSAPFAPDAEPQILLPAGPPLPGSLSSETRLFESAGSNPGAVDCEDEEDELLPLPRNNFTTPIRIDNSPRADDSQGAGEKRGEDAGPSGGSDGESSGSTGKKETRKGSKGEVTQKDLDQMSEGSSQTGDFQLGNAAAKAILQFSTSMYFCCPQYEDVMTLDIMRIGNTEVTSKVHVTTIDQSAKAGESYVGTSKIITFHPGDYQAVFEIPLLKSERWGTTTEFSVLCQEEGLEGAELGRYLFQSRVKVINKNLFPTNRYKEEIEADTWLSLPSLYMLMEYFKYNFRDPKVKRGTIREIMLNFLHNLKFLFKSLMNVYMLNSILNMETSTDDLIVLQDRSQSLGLVMAVLLVLLIPLHIIDYISPTWGIPGRSQSLIQEGLLTKYLNYEESSRGQLPDGAMMLAATRDRRELVHKGYIKVLSLLRSMGQILAVVLFQFLVPILFDVPINVDIFIPLICYPVIILVCLSLRWSVVAKALSRQDLAENSFAAHVESTQKNLRLIIDYARRPHFENMYKEKVAAYNVAAIAMKQIVTTNKYMGQWMKEFFWCLYVFQGGLKVISGRLSFGVYLTNMIMVQEIGDSWGSIYETLLDMAECIPNMERFVKFLNLPIDVERRMKLNRMRRSWSNQQRKESREAAKRKALSGDISSVVQALPLDTMPIIVKKIALDDYTIEGDMTIQQGELVAVVGPPGEGKSTVLKMLGAVMLPVGAEAGFFVPSHLRCLHVCEEALFFRGTLYLNMTFGLAPGHVDGKIERVVRILRMLGVYEGVIDHVQSEEECNWNTVLSITQAHQLKLARALICNPELLIIQKPTMAFAERESRSVLSVLQKYVRQRGVGMDKNTRHLRRPRTCIATSSKVYGVEISDQVFMVSKKFGIRKVEKDEVGPMMLG